MRHPLSRVSRVIASSLDVASWCKNGSYRETLPWMPRRFTKETLCRASLTVPAQPPNASQPTVTRTQRCTVCAITGISSSHAAVVAYWNFDTDFTADMGGAGADFIPHNGGSATIPPTDTNVATISTNNTKFGTGAASFDRANMQYAQSGTAMAPAGNDYSYSVWYYFDIANITYDADGAAGGALGSIHTISRATWQAPRKGTQPVSMVW